MIKIIDENNLVIRNKSTFFIVQINTILYIEKLKNSKTVVLKTTDDVIKSVCCLKEILEILGTNFSQIHKSMIVNLDFVRNIEKDKSLLYLKNGEKIYGSQKYLSDLIETWAISSL